MFIKINKGKIDALINIEQIARIDQLDTCSNKEQILITLKTGDRIFAYDTFSQIQEKIKNVIKLCSQDTLM
jgi:hypothetical protein